MGVKLLTEHRLKYLSLKEVAQARLSLTCQNATLLKMTCHGSYFFLPVVLTKKTHVIDTKHNNPHFSEYITYFV